MAKTNASNERTKWKYLRYLKEADGKSEASVDAVAAAISRFQESINGRDFKTFHKEQAIAFKKKLAEQLNAVTGEKLSKSTLDGTLRALREFFHWLAREPGYKSKIEYSDAHYFNLSARDSEIARAKRPRRVPTLEQIHHVLSLMPADTDIERRDRAVMAFAVLTGARDGALASLKLKHVDMIEGKIIQDGRDVATKRSKTIQTWFFPVGGVALEIAVDWVDWLRKDQLFSDNDPLFPKTKVARDNEGYFRPAGLAKDGWSNAQPIRKIFKLAFENAGLEPVNPHSVRNMLVQLGERVCPDIETFKSWSQNLGHTSMLTTLTSYGQVPDHRQAELIRKLGRSKTDCDPLDDPDVVELINRIAGRRQDSASNSSRQIS
jgi:integrase